MAANHTTITRAPGRLPLLGHAWALRRDPYAFLRTLPAHGDLVEIGLGPAKVVVVCDTELTHTLLLDGKTYDKGGPLFDRLRDVIGDNIVTCPHSRHRAQRRLVQPAFTAARLPGYAAAMSARIDRHIDGWRDGESLDIQRELLHLVSAVLVETMFSGALSARDGQAAVQDVEELVTRLLRQTLLPRPLTSIPTPGNRRYQRASTRLRTLFAQVIAERRASGDERPDLLSALLGAAADGVDADGDDMAISNQLTTFFIAGTESTASVLTWALYLLSRHPRIARHVHEEIDSVVGARAVRFEDLTRLRLTAHVITETLRLYPPTWLITRTLSTAARLGRHDLKAGTTVMFSPYLLHHRDNLYERPEEFDPGRWDTATAPHLLRTAFFPFSAGARRCVADKFVLAEMTLALAAITSRWVMTPVPEGPVRPGAGQLLVRPHRLVMTATSRVPGSRR
ncbi:cytochrome P450 [Streptomyces sp. NPDC048290]|uniref:cytochrome P450 n=1 Tax=Streptomyces sp. NPDC048290 TaxID=3155811 RepID=UPI003436B50A